MRSPKSFVLPVVIAIHGALCHASTASTVYYSDAAAWNAAATQLYNVQTSSFNDLVLTPGPAVYNNQGSLTVQSRAMNGGVTTFLSSDDSITVGAEAGNGFTAMPFIGTIQSWYYLALGMWITSTSPDWEIQYNFGVRSYPGGGAFQTYSHTESLNAAFVGIIVKVESNADVPGMSFDIYNKSSSAASSELVISRMDRFISTAPEPSSLVLTGMASLLGFRRSRRLTC